MKLLSTGKILNPKCELVEAQSYDLNQEVGDSGSNQSISVDEYEDFSNFSSKRLVIYLPNPTKER